MKSDCCNSEICWDSDDAPQGDDTWTIVGVPVCTKCNEACTPIDFECPNVDKTRSKQRVQ